MAPTRPRAGHDINYVAIGGPLGAVGFDTPVLAMNLLGDFASGSFPAVLGTVWPCWPASAPAAVR